LGAVWFGQVSLAWGGVAPEAAKAGSVPGGSRRVAAILLALVAFAALLGPLGFRLTMLALLLFLPFVFDLGHPLAKVIVAVAGSVGTHYVFEGALRVPLPAASLPALWALGF
jgi:hypothetical protein